MEEVRVAFSDHKIDPVDIERQINRIVQSMLNRFTGPGSASMRSVEGGCGGFEIYGLDFIVDRKGLVFLLEVNSNPDFKATDQAKFNIYRKPIDVVLKFLRRKLKCMYERARQSRSRFWAREFTQVNKSFGEISCDCNMDAFAD